MLEGGEKKVMSSDSRDGRSQLWLREKSIHETFIGKKYPLENIMENIHDDGTKASKKQFVYVVYAFSPRLFA